MSSVFGPGQPQEQGVNFRKYLGTDLAEGFLIVRSFLSSCGFLSSYLPAYGRAGTSLGVSVFIFALLVRELLHTPYATSHTLSLLEMIHCGGGPSIEPVSPSIQHKTPDGTPP